MNAVSAFSVKPGIFGNAPSPLSKTMYNVSMPCFVRASAYSFGRVRVYCVEPLRFRIVIILCSTIFGMLIWFISAVDWARAL